MLSWLGLGVALFAQIAPSSIVPQDLLKAALGSEYAWVWKDGGVISSWRIPANNMAPILMAGDRALAVRNSDDPRRGDIWVFKHPSSDRNLVKRLVGLPGDTIEVRNGRLILNGQAIERTWVRDLDYWEDRSVIEAIEYSEQFPGEKSPHLIHEFSDSDGLDETPVFKVPAGRLFFMGDNRDNSEDSRAPSGHRAMARATPEEWPHRSTILPANTDDDAIGFVPIENLIARVASVVFSTRACPTRQSSDVACLPAPIGKRL